LHGGPLNGGAHTSAMGMGHQPSAPAETSQDEYLFSLEAIFRVIRRRLWVIVLVPLLLTGAAVGYSLYQTPTYEASIKIMIGQSQESGSADLSSEVLGLQQLTQTMAAAVNTRPVAETVIERQDLRESPKEFLEHMSVSPIANTQFIEVSYIADSPQQAQRIANEIGRTFSERVATVIPSSVSATVWEPAALPRDPVSPDPMRSVIIALMLGTILGLGLAFLLDRADDSWRSPDEVEQVSGVPNIGLIPSSEASRTRNGRR